MFLLISFFLSFFFLNSASTVSKKPCITAAGTPHTVASHVNKRIGTKSTSVYVGVNDN